MSTHETSANNPFATQVLLTCTYVLLFVVAAATLVMAAEFFLLMFAAILFAIFLTATSSFISSLTGLSQKTSLTAFVILLLVLTAIGIYAGGTMLIEQSREAIEGVRSNAGMLEKKLSEMGVSLNLSDISSKVAGGQSLGAATKFFSSTFGFLTNGLFVIVVGVFLASSPQSYLNGFARLWPDSYRDGVAKLMRKSAETLKSWLLGQLVAMTMIGVITGTSLALLGVPAAFALGLFAGLISFIPTIGATLAIVPALMMAAQQGSGTVIAVLVIYGITQFLESNVATPLIQNQQVDLSAAEILGGQLFAGLLFGFLGVALVTPFLAVVQLWLRLLYLPARDQNLPIRKYVGHVLENPEVMDSDDQNED